jgi:6-phosphofructokinase
MSTSPGKLLKGNAVIGQSGGPTAVINQSLVGCVEGLRGSPYIEKIYGAKHAVRGIVNSDFVDLSAIAADKLDRVAKTPSSALGSSRDKPDAEYCKRIFASLEKNNIRYFFYIGGNDSSDTCRLVNESAQQAGYDLRAFHIPKTIDNDLQKNDHTPGFGSAARYVASAFTGDNLDNAALPGIKINVIMGRHAGFLTAAAVLARQSPGDGPHLIYVPETAFDETRFLAEVDAVYKKHGRCLIAVSEGIADKDHTAIAAKLALQQGAQVDKDSHGNIQLAGSGALGDFLATHLKNNLGKKLRVRADTFGYAQRSFPGSQSPSDAAEARAVGRKAAEHALKAEVAHGSVSINRTSDDPYTIEYGLVQLTDVAAKTRHMPEDFLSGTADVSAKFVKYLKPIVGELPVVQTLI